ncbi:MAG TPA: type II toxin-antitoxin system VapB family antitoxin [Lacipirellulaceae bacterium]|nr:type II toxin-antitoxin system VapB family antitoxin [Lacipirellulaceae bacterium]
MRTKITIDDDLVRKAAELMGPGMDKAEIVREAMRVQSGKRLAVLGGSVPGMRSSPRRRDAGRAGP